MSVSHESTEYGSTDTDDGRNTSAVLNGIAGGVVGTLLSFVPFSLLVGGAVAGYLEGGEYVDGARAGALAGATALVPLVAAGIAVWISPALAVPAPGLAFAAIAGSLLALYTVGLGALGGVVGVHLAELRVSRR